MLKGKQKVTSLLLVIVFSLSTILGTSSKAMATSVNSDDERNLKLIEAKEFIEKATLEEGGSPEDNVKIIVQMQEKPVIEQSNSDFMFSKAVKVESLKKKQINVINKVKSLEGAKVKHSYSYLVNGFSAEVKRGEISRIKNMPGVKKVTEVKRYKQDMASAKALTQVLNTWKDSKLPLKGEKMVVSIIDSGIDYTHKDMRLSNPENAKIQNKDPKGPGKYYTDKVPYGYNFADDNDEVIDRTESMHGMHVAGIVASNCKEAEGVDAVKGVAPEAQLLAMKVFSNDPTEDRGCSSDDVIAAIEDSVLHEADVINMSLGSPAGFQDPDAPEQKAIKNAVDNGVMVVVSAGNSAFQTSPEKNPKLVDTALVGSPGLAKDSLQVASYENSNITSEGLEYSSTEGKGNDCLVYFTSEVDPVKALNDDNGYLVVDCGKGGNKAEKTGDDFGSNVRGKIALVQKINGSFKEKKLAAQNAGAIGVIFYNAEGDDNIYHTKAVPEVTIPCINISYSNGAKLKSLINKELRVKFSGKITANVNGNTGEMSDFTSWGPTPNLDFKPQITAPGGQIYSTINNNSYKTMSGTSMAAPHVSGAQALILQGLKSKNLGIKGRDLVNLAKATAINTSMIVMDKSQDGKVPYSPRRQGAGMIQIKDAIENTVIVTDKNGDSAISLKEIGKETKFSLKLKNYGDLDVSYTLEDKGVLTEIKEEAKDKLIPDGKLTFSSNTVTVKAKGETTVEVTLSVPKGFESEQFVEGFIKFKSSDSKVPSLTVPYIGFYGDWSKPEIIDKPIWNDDVKWNGSSLISMETVSKKRPDHKGYMNVKDVIHLGQNAIDADGKMIIDPTQIAISPNDDNERDVVAAQVTMLRNCKDLKIELLDKDKKVLGMVGLGNDIRKNMHSDAIPYKNILQGIWDGKLYNPSKGVYETVPDGQYYLNLKSRIGMIGDKEQDNIMPVKVDTTKPEVEITSTDKDIRTVRTKQRYTLKWKANDKESGLASFYNIYGFKPKWEKNNGAPTIKLNGENRYPTVKCKDGEFYCEFDLDKGLNKIDLTVKDNGANTTTKSIAVQNGEVEKGQPVVFYNIDKKTIAGPKDVKNGKATIRGAINEDVKELLINDEKVKVNEERKFEHDVTLIENGEKEFKIVAKDVSGKELYNDTHIIELDTTAPILEVKSTPEPVDGIVYTDKKAITLEGKISDKNGCALFINGEFCGVNEDGTFKTMATLNPGDNIVEVVAMDLVENMVVKEFSVAADMEKVPLKYEFKGLVGKGFKKIESGMMVKSKEFLVVTSANHPLGSITVNGVEMMKVKGGAMTYATLVELKEGTNKVRFVVKDVEGKLLSDYSYDINCDTIAPEIDIQNTIEDNEKIYTNTDYIELNCNVSDNTNGYKFYVNGSQELFVKLDGTSGKENTLRNFKKKYEVKNGDIIALEAIDLFDNYATKRLTVVVDKVAPNKPIIKVDEKDKKVEAVTITLDSLAADKDVTKIEYKIGDNGEWTEYNEPFKVTENTKVYARTFDKAGNISEEEVIEITNIEKAIITDPENPNKPTDPTKPEEPKKPENPTKPQEPTKPETPEKPIETENPVDKQEATVDTETSVETTTSTGKLVKTGSPINNDGLVLFGVMIAGLGTLLFIRKK